jgi:hypothetical protein
VFCDRFGRLCFHGRLAKLTPEDIYPTTGGEWIWRHWKAGDRAAVNADPAGTAVLNRSGSTAACRT